MLSILNALTLAALYTLLSAGLALIFGLRNVMNFAHGALYMVGAYLGYSVGQAIGFWPALVIVPLVMAAFGAVLEYGLLRPLAKRSVLEMALITYGLSLIIGQVIIEVYGGNTRPLNPPAGLGGSASIFGVHYPTYRLLIIGIGLGAVFGVFAWLRWTRTGLFVRAVSRDRTPRAWRAWTPGASECWWSASVPPSPGLPGSWPDPMSRCSREWEIPSS